MSRAVTTVYRLAADDITLARSSRTGALSALFVGDGVEVDLYPGMFSPEDTRGDRIAALERLAELALEAASELRTGQTTEDGGAR